MGIKIKLPSGAVVECDTPEEAKRFVDDQRLSEPPCRLALCVLVAGPDLPDSPHCYSCACHHYGAC